MDIRYHITDRLTCLFYYLRIRNRYRTINTLPRAFPESPLKSANGVRQPMVMKLKVTLKGARYATSLGSWIRHCNIRLWETPNTSSSVLVWSERTKGPFTRNVSDDSSDTVFIENNGVARKWVATPIWSDSIVLNESSIARVITELSRR